MKFQDSFISSFSGRNCWILLVLDGGTDTRKRLTVLDYVVMHAQSHTNLSEIAGGGQGYVMALVV